jgi:TRAP-type C4-dicarboxylate transport system permease small subunit
MLRRLVGGFDLAAAFLCCALVTTLLVCVALGVVTRTAGDPLIWTDELSRFLMVWLAVLGWIVASRKRLHVRIRYFQDLLPKHLHRAVEVAIQVAVSLLGMLVCIYGVALVAKNVDLEATSLPISMAWLYAPMVLAGLVTAVQGGHEVLELVLRPRTVATSDVASPK